ncbi:GNAT family N-acetyltransferase [Brenneria uluponensis]|uniref:GNAT family N-acetyltransferase n=1 Tax=Brenneria uluponensis TaxID=3057057 RepID=UPI0028E36818|nr:GNAT family N-acetyltransferase [Brenneria ulupoensis]
MNLVVIEEAKDHHIAAIQAIYSHHVLHGIATFETESPDIAEMQARLRKVHAEKLPWLVALRDDLVVGYCYLSLYRTRRAYRFTVEDSVYIHPDVQGQGVGKKLLSTALTLAENQGYRQMIAVIGNSENHASLRLHQSLGFEMVGTLRSVGMKHGRWVDTVLLQRALGAGDTILPDEA